MAYRELTPATNKPQIKPRIGGLVNALCVASVELSQVLHPRVSAGHFDIIESKGALSRQHTGSQVR